VPSSWVSTAYMLRPPRRSWAWPSAMRPMSTASRLMCLRVGACPMRSLGAGHGGPAGEPAGVGQQQVLDSYVGPGNAVIQDDYQ